MINIGIGLGWAKAIYSVASNVIANFRARVLSYPNSIFEAGPCLNATLEELNAIGLLDNASLIVTPNAYNEGALYDVVPNTPLGDMNVVRATAATRVNSAGLIESVGNNIPRIDYSNGSCPSLLVEPQRTNIFSYSEQFDNPFWIKGAIGVASPIVTPNVSISPDGTLDADQIVFPSVSAGQVSIMFVPFSSTNQNFTQSYYIRGLLGTEVIWFGYTSDGVNFVSKACNLTIGWQRFDLSTLIGVGGSNVIIGVDLRDPAQTARPAQTVFMWGGQLEVGVYPTSYIPTVASSVTRNADVISKTGISSLIGQTEGTVFIDVIYDGIIDNANARKLISLNDGTSNNLIDIFLSLGSNFLNTRVRTAGSSIGDITYLLNSGRYKIAYGYKNSSFVLYINGVLIDSVSTGSISFSSPVSLAQIGDGESSNDEFGGFINSAILFKTRLSNAELSQLTTI